jgi:DNA-binding response OmpR family regulator
MKKYKACVVDVNPQELGMFVTGLRLASDFDAFGYDEAERLLRDAFDSDVSPQKMPDLIVVDLKLKRRKMQGFELISELAERDVPSEVLAISACHPNSSLEEAIRIGAADMIPRPFSNFVELIKKMEHLAEIGLRRRMQVLKTNGSRHEFDLSRSRRPVFLSYCSKDIRLATGIRRSLEGRNIGVWYAPTTLEIGDDWMERIEKGIDQSSIFIALLTDNYINSNVCCAELMRFYRRMEANDNQELLLFPVLDGLSENNKRHYLLRPILEQYQYIDLSRKFDVGLTVLLGRTELQVMLENKRKTPPRASNQLRAKVHRNAA